jgi:hypothetical protein
VKVFVIIFSVFLPRFFFGQRIREYQPVLYIVQYKNSNAPEELAVRSFISDTQQVFLIIQPDSMITRICPAGNYTIKATTWKYLRKQWALKPYIKALVEARHHDAVERNAGIDDYKARDNGISLTIDLCPSRKAMDKRVFLAILKSFQSSKLPVPIGIAISGKWMSQHPDDLDWLKTLVAKNEMDLFWINHTLHHHYSKDVPLDKNFLLSLGTNINSEVLGNEELMLNQGMLPSCFFRFPGLISTKKVFDQILEWGLIPIGSDAWLAKGQYPKSSGSIVLIHANGNEPVGVEEFIKLLHKNNASSSGHWKILDLREELGQ